VLRSFLRSTAPIARLLVLGICTSPAIFLLPASTTMISEGVTTTTGPDARTLILSIGLTTLGLLAFATAGFLAYRRITTRRRTGKA
jgi:hypothetical protein